MAVCQQPNYFPWLGYLEQCARADVLVVLDSVQWMRRGMQHRTRVLPPVRSSDEAPPDFQWLTLPVHGRGHRATRLRDLRVDVGTHWWRTHWRTLEAVYGRRPYFRSQLEPLVRPWLERAASTRHFWDVSLDSLRLLLDALRLSPEIALGSELPERGAKTERLVALCEAVGAEAYYSGLGSIAYVDPALFRAAGVRLVWQHWKHPAYDQGRAAFRSHLSALDALANAPFAEIRRWIQPKPWQALTTT